MTIPLLANKYRLELHWSKALFEVEGTVKLIKAYFSGPALNIANKINENDEIIIDMTTQYLVFIPYFYLANLSWKTVVYNKDGKRVYLNDTVIVNKHVNSLPKLEDSDYFVFDVANHEEEIHRFNPNYTAYLVNEGGELYSF